MVNTCNRPSVLGTPSDTRWADQIRGKETEVLVVKVERKEGGQGECTRIQKPS